MKKLFYVIFAATTIVGCTNGDLVGVQSPNPSTSDTPQSGAPLAKFTATIGDVTRVDLGDKTAEGYPLMWEAGDQITITDGTTTGVYELASVDNNGVGTFAVIEGSEAAASGAELYTAWSGEGASYSSGTFTYTIPATQTYTEGHNLVGKLPLFAQSSNTTLVFKTPAAIVRLNLTKEEAIGISQIQILGHFSSAPMAGSFKNTITNGEFGATTTVSGKANLTYNAGDVVVDSEGESFFLIMPARTYTYSSTSTRFHIQCTYSDGYGDYLRPSATITTKAGVVMPISLQLKKVTRLTGVKLSDLKEATSVVFKTRSTEDFSDSNRFKLLSSGVDKKYYPAYVEWNEGEATVHTSGDAFLAQSSAKWFDATGTTNTSTNFTNLTSVDFGESLDLSQITLAEYMFCYCKSLQDIKFGESFNTANITSMVYMFQECRSLKNVDLSGFDTSKVTKMDYMFENCTALEELDLSTWDLSKLPKSGSSKNSWGGTKMFNNVGSKAANKPIKIYLNDAAYKHIEAVRELKKADYPDSSANWLGSGEGVNWILVNVDAE